MKECDKIRTNKHNTQMAEMAELAQIRKFFGFIYKMYT